MNKRIILSFVLLLSTVLFFSCSPDQGEEQEPVAVGNSIFVPNEVGAVVEVPMEFDADWSVEGSYSWFVLTPKSGSAGPVNLTVSVLEENTSLQERVSSFTVNCGGKPTAYYVIQDVMPGFSVSAEPISVTGAAQTYTISFECNVDYTAEPDADWLTVTDIQYDSVLLEDNVTYSKYRTSYLTVSLEENSGDTRDGNIILTAEDGSTTATVTVRQVGNITADFSKDFKRRSLAIKFTGTWCSYCPPMSEGMEQALETYPDRIVLMYMYEYSRSESLVRYVNTPYFQTLCGNITNFPTGIMNFYAKIPAIQMANVVRDVVVELAQEATEELPSSTAIGGLAYTKSDSIILDLSIASKEAGDYYISAFLLEDGLVAYQANTSEGYNYVHDYVTRTEFTREIYGDPISLSAEAITEVSYRLRVPSVVQNVDNLHVVVFTSYRGTYDGGSDKVANISYGNIGYVVDNVIDLKLNELALFSYEE